MARPIDAVAADLLERLPRLDDLASACSLLLERVAVDGGFDRAVFLLRVDEGSRGVGYNVPDARVGALVSLAGERRGAALLPLRVGPPSVVGADEVDGVFAACVVIPFPGLTDDALGSLLVDAGRVDARVAFAAELLRRCGPSLARIGQRERMAVRGDRLNRQRDLLTSILDWIPDPVLLTSADNAILLANRRADRVFSSTEEDTEGRRRAIQVNTLLFSSFLTRTVIGTSVDPAGRELTLVNPSDGSDLVFEVLSAALPRPLAPEGSVLSILRDITDLKRAVTQLEDQFHRSRLAEHQARHERDQLDAILENVSDPILVTDEQTNIILMNPESDRLFVLDPAMDPDAPASRAVQANDTRFTTLISDFLLRPEHRQVVTLEITDPDTGRAVPVEVASSKILDARGEPRAMVSILHDLTQVVENERLARELQQLNSELEDRIRQATLELEERNRRLEWQSYEIERAYRLKSEFLASMSHELRTPLNVILGYTSLTRERIYGDLSKQQDEALGKIYGTSQHLLDLINDILDLSKIEAGKMPVHIEPVALAELVTELSETIRPMVDKKRLDYETRIETDLPVLHTDRTKLKQILLNLLSNAIKFTHEGSIRMEARCAPAGDRVQISVRDTGIGIQPEHRDMIFEDFRQVDQSRTREYGGTGLGLSITKKLLSLLGGVISLDSEYGEGSCFTIALPINTEAGSLEDQVRRAVIDSDSAVVKP